MGNLTAMKSSAEKTAIRAEKRRAKAAAEMTRLLQDIPRFLSEHGPTEFVEIARALNATTGRLSMAGKELADRGIIHRYRICPGRDSRRVWSLQPQPEIETKPRAEYLKSMNNIEREDLEWMERQRSNAAERMARSKRMAHW